MVKKLLLIPAAVAWIGLPALGAHVLFGQSPVAHQIRPTKIHETYASTTVGSLDRACLGKIAQHDSDPVRTTDAMRDLLGRLFVAAVDDHLHAFCSQ